MLTSLSEKIRKAYHLLMSIYEQLFFLKVPMTRKFLLHDVKECLKL